MCQLTFVNVRNKDFIKKFLITQLILNSESVHQDGSGIFVQEAGNDKGKVIKTVHAPIDCSDIGEYFTKQITLTAPVIGHVRKASTKISEVKVEHSHPFRHKKSNIILAHNGTLEFKDKIRQRKVDKEFPDMIDSQIFLEALARVYKPGKMKEALVRAMELFTGKFALLIYEGETKKYFVVRGKALLHYCEVFLNEKSIGYVINTSKGDLELGLHILSQTWSLGKVTTLTWSAAELLKEETIFEVQKNGLKEVGGIKEETSYAVTTYNRASHYPHLDKDFTDEINDDPKALSSKNNQTVISRSSDTDYNTKQPEKQLQIATKIIAEFKNCFALSLEEVDLILWLVLGATISSITPQDLKEIKLELTPMFEAYIEENGGKGTFYKKVKKWEQARTRSLLSPMKLYKKFPNLQFPFFVNTFEDIHKVELFFRQEKKVKNSPKKAIAKVTV